MSVPRHDAAGADIAAAESGDGGTPKDEATADDEDEKAKGLDHDDSIASGVDRSGMGSPERFIDRLNRQLRKVGVVVEGMPVKTRPSGGPPCFRVADTNYQDWLTQASVAYETLPYRLSMPAEPNYCHDCTPAFKAEMMAVRACRFPDVTFEIVKEFGESTQVGVSHSPEVAPEDYPVYSDILDKRRP